MANNYIPSDRTKQYLLPPSLTDWVHEDHLVWFVIDAVGKMDTSALHARHPQSGPGRSAYNPDMMATLLLYAYCTGTFSSRQIEQACRQDLAYRVITANEVPDHGTIARFRANCEDQIEVLFIHVLAMCTEAGMGKLGIVALDGTRIAASASLKATRTRAQIEKEVDALRGRIEQEVAAMLARAATEDADQDRLFGVDRGDELPQHLANPRSRLAHLEEALRRLDQRQVDAREQEREALAGKTAKRVAKAAKGRGRLDPRRRPRYNPSVAEAEADLEVAKADAASARAARAKLEAAAKAEGRKIGGTTPDLERGIARAEAELARAEEMQAQATAKERINTTDADSEIMKTQQGYLQGYNPQAVVSEDQIILAANVTNCASDGGQYIPMVNATLANIAAAGIEALIGCVLADAGYLSNDNLRAGGPDRYIATSKAYKLKCQVREEGFTQGDPPLDAPLIEAMTHRLRTQEGAATYAKRQYTVEPVFGHTKENRGYRRFMRRGLTAVDAEWKLLALTHNLLKLFAKGKQLNGRTTTIPHGPQGRGLSGRLSSIRACRPIFLSIAC